MSKRPYITILDVEEIPDNPYDVIVHYDPSIKNEFTPAVTDVVMLKNSVGYVRAKDTTSTVHTITVRNTTDDTIESVVKGERLTF